MPTKAREWNTSAFLREYTRIHQKVDTLLKEFLKYPDEDNTHDVRGALRRLNASFQLLSRREWNLNNDFGKYEEQSKKVLKSTSPVRDIDIIRGKLKGLGEDSETKSLAKSLKTKRRRKLKQAMKEARKLLRKQLRSIETVEISDFGYRTKKIVSVLERKIQKNLASALAGEENVRELHTLRKTVKKLRYTLEIINWPQENERIKLLRDWQDFLGEILDSDVLIKYLRHLKSNEWIAKNLKEEEVMRHGKYESFVRLCGESEDYLPLLKV